MGRRNNGPRLQFLTKRGAYYIRWTERGRSRERSTGTADRREAEVVFAEWLGLRQRDSGPRDPDQVLITDILADYAEERAAKIASPERISYAIMPLVDFWEGKAASQVNERSCDDYGRFRFSSARHL